MHWPAYFARRYLRIGIPLIASKLLADLLGIQHTIYKWFAAPLVLFAGLLALTYRSTRRGHGGAEPRSSEKS